MNRFRCEPVPAENQEKWNRFLDQCPPRFSHEWDYLSCIAAGVGQPVRLAIKSRDHQYLATAVFVERRIRILRHWRHPSPAPFAGLLYRESDQSESFLRDAYAALSEYVWARCQYADMITAAPSNDIRGLTLQGHWEAAPHYNYIQVVSVSEPLETQSENGVRRQKANALKAGLRIQQDSSFDKGILALLEQTIERQSIGAWVLPATYDSLLAAPPRQTNSYLFSVRDAGGVPQAAALFVVHGARAYYLMGCSSHESEGAPSLLHLEASKALVAVHGPLTYDWCGANTASVAQFKKKFRPTLELSLRCVYRSKLARVMTKK